MWFDLNRQAGLLARLQTKNQKPKPTLIRILGIVFLLLSVETSIAFVGTRPMRHAKADLTKTSQKNEVARGEEAYTLEVVPTSTPTMNLAIIPQNSSDSLPAFTPIGIETAITIPTDTAFPVIQGEIIKFEPDLDRKRVEIPKNKVRLQNTGYVNIKGSQLHYEIRDSEGKVIASSPYEEIPDMKPKHKYSNKERWEYEFPEPIDNYQIYAIWTTADGDVIATDFINYGVIPTLGWWGWIGMMGFIFFSLRKRLVFIV